MHHDLQKLGKQLYTRPEAGLNWQMLLCYWPWWITYLSLACDLLLFCADAMFGLHIIDRLLIFCCILSCFDIQRVTHYLWSAPSDWLPQQMCLKQWLCGCSAVRMLSTWRRLVYLWQVLWDACVLDHRQPGSHAWILQQVALPTSNCAYLACWKTKAPEL